MRYYVYAIHMDHTANRLYNSFDDFFEAEKLKKEMREGNYAGDNYWVTMFSAKTDEEAVLTANSMRTFPKMMMT